MVMDDQDYQRVPLAEVLEVLRKHDGIERARLRAAEFTEKARELLAQFPDSAAQRALTAVTDLVADRDR